MSNNWTFPMELATWLRIASIPEHQDSIFGVSQAQFLYDNIIPILCDDISSQEDSIAQVLSLYTPEDSDVSYPLIELSLIKCSITFTLLYAGGKWAVSVHSATPLSLSQDIYEHISGDPLLAAGMPVNKHYEHYLLNQCQFSFIVNGSHALEHIMHAIRRCINN